MKTSTIYRYLAIFCGVWALVLLIAYNKEDGLNAVYAPIIMVLLMLILSNSIDIERIKEGG